MPCHTPARLSPQVSLGLVILYVRDRLSGRSAWMDDDRLFFFPVPPNVPSASTRIPGISNTTDRSLSAHPPPDDHISSSTSYVLGSDLPMYILPFFIPTLPPSVSYVCPPPTRSHHPHQCSPRRDKSRPSAYADRRLLFLRTNPSWSLVGRNIRSRISQLGQTVPVTPVGFLTPPARSRSTRKEKKEVCRCVSMCRVKRVSERQH